METAEQAVKALRTKKEIDILGPAPAMIEKTSLGFHWKLILKSSKELDPKGTILRQAARHVLNSIPARGIRVNVDVDPYQTL